MDSTQDLELLTVTVLSAVMFTVLYYFFVQIVGGVLTVPMAAVIGGMGSLFSYSATQLLFGQRRARKK